MARQRYYPYGAVRPGGTGTLPTDYTFTGQKNVPGTGLMYYGARYYEPALGRFVSADTIVPEPGNPQVLNRYAYCTGNPLRYTDPTGHINNNPTELARADEILSTLTSEYDVAIDEDWGWLETESVGSPLWNPGSWELAELETALEAVTDLSGLMGGSQQFRNNLGGVQVMRKDMIYPGMADAHEVWLRSIGSGGFLGQWQSTWTVAHELAHAWDAVNNWQLSKNLEDFTGGRTTWLGTYHPGGTPPKGADDRFTREEDFAESVTTFIYPQTAQAFIQTWYEAAQYPQFQYSNYYHHQRAMFVADLVDMDPHRILFLTK